MPLGSAYQGLESRLQVFSCEASILTEIKQVALLLTWLRARRAGSFGSSSLGGSAQVCPLLTGDETLLWWLVNGSTKDPPAH